MGHATKRRQRARSGGPRPAPRHGPRVSCAALHHASPVALSPSPPGRGPLIALLLAHIAFGLFAMTLPIPSMQQWGAMFGAPQSLVQLSFSAYVVAFGAAQLLGGPWSDRWGRKPVLLGGLALALLGSVAAAAAPDLPALIAARVLQGAGAAAGAVVGRALVQDLVQGAERTRVMAWVGMTLGLCPPTATIVGGQLHEHLGWRSHFVLAALIALLLAGATWRWLPHRPGTAAPGRWWVAMGAAYARLLREPVLMLYVGLTGFITAAFYAFLGGAPLVLGSLGVGPGGIGFYILAVPVSYIAGNFVAGRLARRVGEQRLMWAGQAATLASLMLLLALSGLRHPLAFTLPLMLLGVGHGLLMPPVLSGLVGTVPALAGAAAALGGLSQQLVGAFGAWSVGWFDHRGTATLGALMLGFTAVAVGLQLALWRLRRRRPGPG